ncbi:hypothetical protein L218DRAFT_943209 [Marasmius fiardii PR-910]|nr:hypothetical protein L218DRAFT_943209 [Marasmius fiardii PR-910]
MLFWFRTTLLFLALVFHSSASQRLLSHAKTVSRIIDDGYGDEETEYRPGCAIAPDPNFLQNGTWTAATYRTSLSDMGFALQFRGTAVSVYFTLTNDIDTSIRTKDTECNFTLDTSYEGRYEHKAVSGRGFDHNVQVFNRTGLENKWRVLLVNTGKLDHATYISFDYARHTTEVPDNSDENGSTNSTNTNNSNTSKTSKERSNAGAIVGGVVGGMGLLSGVLLSLFIIRRKKSSAYSHDEILNPYPNYQVEATTEQSRGNLQTQERGQSHSASESALREQIQTLLVRLDSLQNRPTPSQDQPSEPPPGYQYNAKRR